MNIIKKVFYFSIIIIFIIGCFSGCSNKKRDQNIDTKIAIEIDFLDNELSDFLDGITENVKSNYYIVEEETKVKNSESSGTDGEEKKNGSEEEFSGNNDSEKVTIMSMQYNDQKSVSKEHWIEIKSSIENLYVSWATIQSDINIKENITEESLKEINKCFDNLLIYATEQNEVSFIKESVTIYNNLIDIAEKTNYDKNKLYVLKVKKKMYESYTNVLEENWDLAKNNLELANNYLQEIDDIKNKVTIIFKNLLESTKQRDRKIFFIKYAEALNEIKYLNI